jgi:hypothetical protein
MFFSCFSTNKQIAAAFHIIAFGKNCRETRKKHEGYMPSSRAIAEARYASIVRNTGSKHSPETIQKMKNTWQNKLKNGYVGPTKGKITSEETKEKQRQAKLGKPRSQETIDKIKTTKKRQQQEFLEQNNGIKKKLTKDTIEKIRQAALERNKGKINNKYEEKRLKDIEKEKAKRVKQQIKAEERKLKRQQK